MKSLVKHFGKVDDKARLHYLNTTLWNQQLVGLMSKDVEITIKERSKKPTLDQFGYYRGAVLGVCWESETFQYFNKPDDIHSEYFAPMFLSYTKIVQVGDKKKEQVFIRSMADLDRKETSDFIERVIAHLQTEWDIHVLTPEEYQNKHYQSTRE